MKKTLIAFLFLSICLQVNSQSIGEEILASIGDSSISFGTTFEDTLDSGPAGIDVIWDFSDFPTDSLFESTKHYLDPSVLDTLDLFPEATIALANNFDTDDYFQKASFFYVWLGSKVGTNNHDRYDPPIILFRFPLAFNEVIKSNSTQTIELVDNNFIITNSICNERVFDGLGTLITPAGEFENCIRIKETRISEDEFFDSDTSFRYNWYFGSLSNEMARWTYSPSFDLAAFRFQTNVNDVTSSIYQIPENKMTIKYLQNGSFEVNAKKGVYAAQVYDLSGRMLGSKTVDHMGNKSMINFDFEIGSSSQAAILLLTNKEDLSFKVLKFHLTNN